MQLVSVETQINEADVSDGNSSANLVFGIPLTQCVENDRLRGSGRSDLVSSMEERSNMARHGSRASFSSLIDSPRGDEWSKCSLAKPALILKSLKNREFLQVVKVLENNVVRS
ncbi:hypothetical protein YQE_01374, partial [Dendroctonus ponderosae]